MKLKIAILLYKEHLYKQSWFYTGIKEEKREVPEKLRDLSLSQMRISVGD